MLILLNFPRPVASLLFPTVICIHLFEVTLELWTTQSSVTICLFLVQSESGRIRIAAAGKQPVESVLM